MALSGLFRTALDHKVGGLEAEVDRWYNVGVLFTGS